MTWLILVWGVSIYVRYFAGKTPMLQALAVEIDEPDEFI
jgi:hypothetical protein